MIKMMLFIPGIIFCLFHTYVQPVPQQTQFILFIIGIVLLGIPHGAADLLVSGQGAAEQKRKFSKAAFLAGYIGRLALFGIVLWLLPLVGISFFILFSAYHFGETDLHQFKTDTLAGKFFVLAYGLLILGVLLLIHTDEIQSLFAVFGTGRMTEQFINQLHVNRQFILSIIIILFFCAAFFYFLTVGRQHKHSESFIIQLGVLLLLLYLLPLLAGFTFYFICWHSVLSLKNIINYLRRNQLLTTSHIVKQILLYSSIAIAGVCLAGFLGFMFASNSTVIIYTFAGLAVLTAPHMQIMHDMYHRLRS
jgi:beta-carotene 15,15'-dioxygenase